MHVSLIYDAEIGYNINSQYSHYVYELFMRDLRRLVYRKRKNYKVREAKVQSLLNLDSPIDLVHLVLNSTELVNINGIYVIRLNSHKKIHNIKVSTLVRLLEYGALGFQELPVIRRVMFKYNRCYKDYVEEFIDKRVVL